MNIQDAVKYYKENFTQKWEEEKYKWIAVKHFSDCWKIDAVDFAGMLEEAFGFASNLLQGGMYYPYKMLCALSKQNPEKMCGLFKMLYDEELPLVERLQPFRDGCDEILKEIQEQSKEPEKVKNHYQDLRALCVYLSFRYPEKYYLYKFKMYSDFRRMTDYQETSSETDSEIRKYDNFGQMCEAVRAAVVSDLELLEMQRNAINDAPDCFGDPEYHLLVQTIIYVNSRRKDEKALAVSNVNADTLADEDIKTVHYWIYSPGKGAAMWETCYKGGFMAIGWDKIGDLNAYNSKDEMKTAMKECIDPDRPYTMAAHATWQFSHEMNPGDIVFAKKGKSLVIGRGIVESDYIYDPEREYYKNLRKVKWTHKGEWPHPGLAVTKTLTDITAYTDYVEELNALFEDDMEEDDEEKAVEYPPYDAEMFLDEVFMDEESYNTLTGLVETKKNVILQGAPGVGKTFAAKRLAYSMMGVKDPNRVMMVQFHQSYSYEDFIMGFRPSENGFELRKGAFYNFCKRAEIDSGNKYFFIIDEINRGNLSKIFGELFMLIESDKRGIGLQLLYSDEKFSVPENVYIIGMMNTADRSLAMLDYALRRRFAFFEMKPGFNTDGFREYRSGLANEKFDRLIHCIENLNSVISSDDSLGEGFCIGHSYFCNLSKITDQVLSGIVEFELIPLIKEYWFDEPTKVKDWGENLRSAIK